MFLNDVIELAECFLKYKDLKPHFSKKEKRKIDFLDDLEKFDCVLSDEEIVKILGLRSRHILNTILPILDFLKSKSQCLFPKELFKKCKIKPRQFRNLVSKLADLKVIKPLTRYDVHTSTSRIFQVNLKMRDKLVHLAGSDKRESISASTSLEADLSKVDITSSCRLPLSMPDETVLEALCKKYPFLREDLLKVGLLNASLPAEEKMAFEPSIHRTSHCISKIGIRLSSAFCSLKKRLEEGDDPRLLTREKYLEKRFPGKTVFSYDFKSSIYRVTYYLNTGKWAPEGYDFYTAFASKVMSRDERSAFKILCMLVYFTKSTREIVKNNKNAIEAAELDRGLVLALLDLLRTRMHSLIGPFYGSKVFLYESSLYLWTLDQLKDKGIDACQVYDEFFSDDKRLESETVRLALRFNEMHSRYESTLENERISIRLPDVKGMQMTDKCKLCEDFNKMKADEQEALALVDLLDDNVSVVKRYADDDIHETIDDLMTCYSKTDRAADEKKAKQIAALHPEDDISLSKVNERERALNKCRLAIWYGVSLLHCCRLETAVNLHLKMGDLEGANHFKMRFQKHLRNYEYATTSQTIKDYSQLREFLNANWFSKYGENDIKPENAQYLSAKSSLRHLLRHYFRNSQILLTSL